MYTQSHTFNVNYITSANCHSNIRIILITVAMITLKTGQNVWAKQRKSLK